MNVKNLIHLLEILPDDQKEFTVITNDLLDDVAVSVIANGNEKGYIVIQGVEEVDCP